MKNIGDKVTVAIPNVESVCKVQLDVSSLLTYCRF